MNGISAAGTLAGALLAVLALFGLVMRSMWRGFRVLSKFLAAVTENTAALGRLEQLFSGHVVVVERRLTTSENRLDALTGRVDHLDRIVESAA